MRNHLFSLSTGAGRTEGVIYRDRTESDHLLKGTEWGHCVPALSIDPSVWCGIGKVLVCIWIGVHGLRGPLVGVGTVEGWEQWGMGTVDVKDE